MRRPVLWLAGCVAAPDAFASSTGTPNLAWSILTLVLLATLLLGWRFVRRRRTREQALLRELRDREEREALALWGSADKFWTLDVEQGVLHHQRLGVGNQPSQRAVSLDAWREEIHPDDRDRVLRLMDEYLESGRDSIEIEMRMAGVLGEWHWIRCRGKTVKRNEAGRPRRMAGTWRDITTERRDERELRIASKVLRSMNEAVAVTDLDFHFVAINPAFTRITGYDEAQTLGQPSRLLDSQQHDAAFYRRMHEAVGLTGHWAGEMWQRRRNGEEFLCWLESAEVCDEAGTRSHFVFVLSDITEKKRAEQELRYLANYDPLTGLPNRALLSERLARAIVRARRRGHRVAVLFLDLDRFKDINDSLGHAAGDRILKSAGARLLETVGTSGTVGRLGGDEFTVVIEEIEDAQAVEAVAREMLAAFARPLEIDDRQDLTITPSIGISLYPEHGLAPTELIKFADTAMYQAKALGRNTYQFYTAAMDAEARRRATVASALRKALEREELRLVFQPRLSLVDGAIAGVEALLRWNSSELGEIPPSDFIPLAEESGQILGLGEWVLREACATLAHWREHGLTEIAMSVNVSVLQLLRGNLPEVIAGILAETGVPASQLELEVTESMVMANAAQSTDALHALREIGVSLAIDDFGTGYSSLIYLKRLPIDTLKIDKEFVGDVTHDPDDEAITATVITMAHSLGLNVIAEGVETEAQLAYLRDQGCDEIQGYWLSRPLDPHHCMAFIEAWQPSSLAAVPAPER